MTAGGFGIAGTRRLAWATLAFGLLAALALSAQAARRGFAPPAFPAPGAGSEVMPPSTRGGATAAEPLPWTAVASSTESGAPAAGTTGTMALPPVPAPSLGTGSAVDAGVVAARPFRLGRAGALDRSRALQCLTAAIYYEAASEPDVGQQAVAQVVLNRVRHPAFPPSVCGVVYQGSERTGCQFSFACDGSMERHLPVVAGWTRAARAAAAALAGRVYAPVGLATHYHTYAVTPSWNRALVMTDAVGAHLFHRWKGWWGTPAAFHQIYAGGEPLPGPHPSAAASADVPVPLIAAAAPVPSRPVATVSAARPGQHGVAPRPAAAESEDRLPPAPTILPRWADSGQPLR